jgi:threonine/homoserine/homoserine lactone efflux protein
MDQWLALVAFSIVSTGSPGPNNVLLWASGAAFGFRPTVPHIVGTAFGIGALALIAAAGLAAIVSAAPALAVVMKIAASAYLLYLAWQVAGAAHVFERSKIARPMSVIQAAAFQTINPKGWFFALGAIAAFRPADLPVVPGSLLVAATMTAVVIPTAAVWAAAGGWLGRLLNSERSRRVVSLGLAALLAASVVSIWR